jgi:two-component system, NtrC family, nitrogen regulation response regulator GlnG
MTIMKSTILIADDDPAIRTVLTQALTRLGHEVLSTGTAANLWEWIKDGVGDLVITDVVMPDESGLDLLPRIRRRRPDLRVIVMSARNTLLTAVQASERGAFDYLSKPFDLSKLTEVVRKALSSTPGVIPDAATPKQADGEQMPLIGRSPPMQEIYRVMARLMGTDLTVMIAGESGTGKELIARALHDYGKRRDGPFVAINMAAIPRELIESELFGHEKGAFTGAANRSTGRFEQARRGTLFLDEIGDMPAEAQTRLLRVLQEGEYTSVGGREPVQANVRIIAATHRDLKQLIRQGLFREDLFYRLNVVPVRLPSLRERREDIPDLVHHFLKQAVAVGLPAKTIDSSGMKVLMTHGWPGNVRELENLVKRLAALYSEENVGAEAIEHELMEQSEHSPSTEQVRSESLSEAVDRHLHEYFVAHEDELPAAGLYDRILREIERPLIARSLGATNGNQLRAAEMLGLNRNTLRKKIRELDIPVVRGLK